MEVNFYATLRPIVGGKRATLDLEEGATVRDLLRCAGARYPGLNALLWDAAGNVSDFIKVFVDGREMRHLQGLDTPVPADATVDIFPPTAGG